MSQVAPQSHEPIEPTPRKRLTIAEVAQLRERQSWLCGCGCGKPLFTVVKQDAPYPVSGQRVMHTWIDEHILPLDLGGSNDLSNRAIYLIECAIQKTRADLKRIAKARRLRRDADPETRRQPVRKLRSRGFQKADPLR